MKLKFYALQLLLFLLAVPMILAAQNIFPESNYKFSLFKKAVQKVTITQADVLKEVWKVDAKKRSITILTMKAKEDFADYKFDDENMPAFDTNYYIARTSIWYFQKKGRLDSVISTENKVAFFGDSQEGGPYGDDMVGKVAQVLSKTTYCYNRSCLAVEKYWYSDEVFTGDSRIVTFNCQKKRPTIATTINSDYTEEFVYDENKRLKQRKSGDRIFMSFEYDKSGNLVLINSGEHNTTFVYNENDLIVEVTKSEGRPQPYVYSYD
jgi:YD repeat-containing protein